MNNIAFIFTHGPHGNASGREGLDVILAASSIVKDIGLFFISDGILLLLPNQLPDQILAKNFITTFRILSLCDINKFYLCADSAVERGFDANVDWILNIKWIQAKNWRQNLTKYNIILTF